MPNHLSPRQSGRPPADLLITNARVWSAGAPPSDPQVIAVKADRIVAVGHPSDAAAWTGPSTRVVDAGGRFAMPGFNDAHVHLMTAALRLDCVNLRDARTPGEFARRIGERAKNTPPGEWITGGDWDEQGWPSPELPSRHLVDVVSADTPVFVSRYDEHMALANTVALHLAGISAATPDPVGGQILRDEAGQPTGILKDAAMAAVHAVKPPASRDRRERAIRHAMDLVTSLGVTTVQDMGTEDRDVLLYATLAERGELKMRVRAVTPAPRLARRLSVRETPLSSSPLVTVSGAKAFADGSLGSATALFFEPYADDPASRGLLADEMEPLEAARDRLMLIDRTGEQLCVHAIGDRAVSLVLDLFAEVEKANGPRDRRSRVEHSQHLRPSDFARYAALGAIASVQPYHAVDDGKWAEKRIGAERAKSSFAFRSFLDHGVRLAFGTDWPVAPLDPVLTLKAAVTRATLDGARPGGWVPEQKVTVAEALAAYTAGSAFAEFRDEDKGAIAAGMLADIVVLSDDPFTLAPEALAGLEVVLTIMGGRVVFERS